MKKRNLFLLPALFAAALTLNTACSDDEAPAAQNNAEQTQTNPTAQQVSGNVSGTWTRGSVINVTGHIVVPQGQSLTIEDGVQVIFSAEGVGVNHVPIEFTVNGNLYIKGTEASPVLLSTEADLRTPDNAFAGLWGGIVAGVTCEEMLIDHAIIEYTGGQVIEGSPAAENGVYTAGDDAYPQITTNNTSGRYVLTNSIIRNGWSDGIYLMGGNAIIQNNTFIANGYDGAEAVNCKAGVKADVVGNVMFSPNTNGLKLSSSGQSETRSQAKIAAYNNTIINAGWRRDGEKGGSVYVEKNALVYVFNNLLVNCKFRAQTPKYTSPDDPEKGYASASVIDYNYYASGSQRSAIVFPDESNVAYAWEGYNYNNSNYFNGMVDAHSVIATQVNGCDPLFVNFNINGVALTDYAYNSSWDFHLQAASPALAGAYAAGDLTGYFSNSGISVAGQTFTTAAPAPRFGAFGTK